MNSLRAKGVMSFQAASAVELAISASRRSAGSLCTTPPGTRALLMGARVIRDLSASLFDGLAASVEIVVGHEQGRVWEFVTAPPRSAPCVASMVGYRALEVPGEVHRGMPSSTLTFIVSLR
jgi:hypothetical protein